MKGGSLVITVKFKGYPPPRPVSVATTSHRTFLPQDATQGKETTVTPSSPFPRK